jgi:hypothetical protein
MGDSSPLNQNSSQTSLTHMIAAESKTHTLCILFCICSLCSILEIFSCNLLKRHIHLNAILDEYQILVVPLFLAKFLLF